MLVYGARPIAIRVLTVSLESQLLFKHTVQQFAVLATIRAIDAVIRTHDRRDTSFYSVCERPSTKISVSAVLGLEPEM